MEARERAITLKRGKNNEELNATKFAQPFVQQDLFVWTFCFLFCVIVTLCRCGIIPSNQILGTAYAYAPVRTYLLDPACLPAEAEPGADPCHDLCDRAR
jgi:hypothetical protein